MGFFREYWQFLKFRKKAWMLPIVFFIVLFGALVIFLQAASTLPFIYTFF